MKETVALVGGGTAGHIYPTLAVGKVLRKKARVIYLGISGSPEEKLAKKEGFEFFPITSGKWHRYFTFSNLFTPWRIGKGFLEARSILKQQNVRAVFAKGGFVSFPVVVASASLKIPVVGHESDSVMGKTNLWLGRFMKKIAVAFPKGLYPSSVRKKLVYTGIPLREEFRHPDPEKIKEKFGLSSDPVLVVTGGSQGALAINELVFRALPILLKKCQVVHLTGEHSIQKAKEEKKKLPSVLQKRYHPLAFSFEMANILATADLVISRAGANTLFELAYLRKPAILIPYPYSAQQHQLKNANFAASLGGAIVFRQEKLNEKEFWLVVFRLLKDKTLRQRMGEKLSQLYRPEAEKKIANLVLREIKKQR
ncbi:undecaprenyldiphospho-muramoylpentapeptide beta-N-acetylglucosaminyltransferase [bacterium]|nr:undecaprenyldiphospho-muramoylpentapeptide beta-N-acetylglucosaminyltransferase [bacterium]